MLTAPVNGQLVVQAHGGSWFAGKGEHIGLWFFGLGHPAARFDDFGGE